MMSGFKRNLLTEVTGNPAFSPHKTRFELNRALAEPTNSVTHMPFLHDFSVLDELAVPKEGPPFCSHESFCHCDYCITKSFLSVEPWYNDKNSKRRYRSDHP